MGDVFWHAVDAAMASGHRRLTEKMPALVYYQGLTVHSQGLV